VRGGPLSNPEIVQLLQPYIVTWWHGASEAEMPADVKEVFTKSELDPKRLNVFALILDQKGRLAHSYYGLPAAAYKAELAKGLAKLNLPEGKAPEKDRPVVLPDLKDATPGAPAGVRIYVRHKDTKPVVEVVPMKAEEWRTLSFPEQAKEIEANALRNWLVQLYPPGITATDERKPFKEITGALDLVPAGVDKQSRYALLRGKIRLARGDDTESAFEGTLQAVVRYRLDTPEVQSVHGVAEGDYLDRIRGTQRLPLKVTIESRPQ
jgi:hypothetical protein